MIIMEKSKAAVLQLTPHIYKSNTKATSYSSVSVCPEVWFLIWQKKKKNQEVKETKKFNFTLRGKEGFFDVNLSNSKFRLLMHFAKLNWKVKGLKTIQIVKGKKRFFRSLC